MMHLIEYVNQYNAYYISLNHYMKFILKICFFNIVKQTALWYK
jgi:hypothetical protein